MGLFLMALVLHPEQATQGMDNLLSVKYSETQSLCVGRNHLKITTIKEIRIFVAIETEYISALIQCHVSCNTNDNL